MQKWPVQENQQLFPHVIPIVNVRLILGRNNYGPHPAEHPGRTAISWFENQ